MSIALPVRSRPPARRTRIDRLVPRVVILTMVALFAVALAFGSHDSKTVLSHGRVAPQAALRHHARPLTVPAARSHASAARPDESKTAAELGRAPAPSEVQPHPYWMTPRGPTVGPLR